MGYCIFMGQTAGCFLIASTMACLPSTRPRDWFGGLALGVVILTKATPLAIAVALCLIGRKRLGFIALGSAAAMCVLTWPWTGAEPWSRFYSVARQLTHLVALDWNSLSLDAFVLRLSRQTAESGRYIATSGESAIIWCIRAPMLMVAAWNLWRLRRTRAATLGIWLTWLALTPMLWTYYLLALFPFSVLPNTVLTAITGALLSASVLLAWAYVPPLWSGTVGVTAWIAATLLFSRGSTEGAAYNHV
jgi:hypothetical protein